MELYGCDIEYGLLAFVFMFVFDIEYELPALVLIVVFALNLPFFSMRPARGNVFVFPLLVLVPFVAKEDEATFSTNNE